ncbi:MAG TPA: 23S rRNA pseudouridine synthase F [Lachnospiraceae bacterium]|nr:23S rRNA pseudouridine synthase F [Lachnospiraceae bacterium]
MTGRNDSMRLNKYLSSHGVCSRREADRMIAQGRITVNGHHASLGQEVTEQDLVEADGKRVAGRAREIFLAVNKPRGVVVTTDRSRGDRILEDLVPKTNRVFAVGRLDKESEGLILMTNNGDVSNLIQKARSFHEKEYEVRVDLPVTEEFLARLRKGVYLDELQRTTRPCKVRRIAKDCFRVILTEGMNRQIRRMCAALGYQVTALKRIRVMNILLGDLPEGAYRPLTQEEIRSLKEQL